MDKEAILRRIDELMVNYQPGDGRAVRISAAFQGALTLASAVYGPESHQVKTLLAADKQVRSIQGNLEMTLLQYALPTIKGTLESLKADVTAGLIGNLEVRGAGAALSDFLGLAKDALAEGTEGSKNVAAVLVAASFEDTIRRMGSSLAGVDGRPTLNEVIEALKEAGVLQGAPLTTGLSYLKFRNDALHADWDRIDRAVVGSCLAFVEGLLLKHFT